jgi:Ser-tRNA(Ala) deacylase AlaX
MTGSTNGTKTDLPATELIYYTYEGNFELECESKVLSCQFIDEEQKTVQLCLDMTVLHAQGGGQPTDLGRISTTIDDNSKVNVTKVLLDRATGVATHTGTMESSSTIKVGDAVHVSVDAENRRILSECHTAGHVVDSAMAKCNTLLPPTKAYHYLEGPYVEYKGTIPAEDRPALLEKLQAAFQELVQDDIDTKIEVLSKENAEEVCNRVAKNYFNLGEFGDDTVRIVTVAGWPCPCGGTHVKSTGDLKDRKWGITGIKCKKGVVRVKYAPNWDN